MRLHPGFASALAISAAILTAPLALAGGGGDSASYHLYPTAAARALMPKPADQGDNRLRPLEYFGGPVLSNVKTVSVIWGNHVNATTVAQIGSFLGALVNSNFIDQLAQYDTNLTAVDGQKGTNQTIARGTYRGQTMITPKNTSSTLTDRQIQKELAQQIAAGKLPAADLNTLYMIYFPANIIITSYGKSCVGFGAYHSSNSAAVTPANLFYGVMPDCGTGFADLTITSSHEAAEAITDAIPTPGSHPVYPQAWNTTNGYEIADQCEGTQTTLTAAGKSYAVQEVYLNSTKKCGTGKFTSP